MSEEEARKDHQRAVARWAESFPDEPPLDPDSFTRTRYDPDTPDKDFLEASHFIPISRILDRVDVWEADANAAPLPARAAFWSEKADALELVHAAGYLEYDVFGFEPGPDELATSWRNRSDSARRLLKLADHPNTENHQFDEAKTLRLAEPSRENDKWGPLIPFLDHAMRTTLDDSSDGILRRLADVCRENEDATDHCRKWDIDISFQVPLPSSTLSRLKPRVFEYRRRQEANPSND